MKYLQFLESRETDAQITKKFDSYEKYLKEKFSTETSAAAAYRFQSSEIYKVNIRGYYLKKKNIPNYYEISFLDIGGLLNNNNFQVFLNIVEYFKIYKWSIMNGDQQITLLISGVDDKFFENLDVEMYANKYNL